MNRNDVKSSCIASVGFDHISKILEIEFVSGSIYQYYNVDQDIYINLISAESIGKYFNKNIAYTFKYNQVSSYSEGYHQKSVNIVNSPPIKKDVESLYRKLALKFHPDITKSRDDLMKLINNYHDEANYYELQRIAIKYGISNLDR